MITTSTASAIPTIVPRFESAWNAGDAAPSESSTRIWFRRVGVWTKSPRSRPRGRRQPSRVAFEGLPHGDRGRAASLIGSLPPCPHRGPGQRATPSHVQAPREVRSRSTSLTEALPPSHVVARKRLGMPRGCEECRGQGGPDGPRSTRTRALRAQHGGERCLRGRRGARS